MSLEYNKSIACQFLNELYCKWDFSVIERIIHEDYFISKNSVSIINFQNDMPSGPGKRSLVDRVHYLYNAMPDLNFEITRVVAEENEVIVWYSWTGTQKGEMFGFPPKNKKVKIFATNYFTIQAGRILTTRITFDSFSFLYQLGHVDFISDDETMMLQYLDDIERISTEFNGSSKSKSDPVIE